MQSFNLTCVNVLSTARALPRRAHVFTLILLADRLRQHPLLGLGHLGALKIQNIHVTVRQSRHRKYVSSTGKWNKLWLLNEKQIC